MPVERLTGVGARQRGGVDHDDAYSAATLLWSGKSRVGGAAQSSEGDGRLRGRWWGEEEEKRSMTREAH